MKKVLKTMHNLNAYLNLTTTIIVSGLTLLAFKPAEAQRWGATLSLTSDSYSDTNNPSTNFGDSEFIQIGNFQNGTGSGDEQLAYFSWGIQDLIAQIPEGSEVRNLTAQLFLTQTNNDPNNPNDPNRSFPTLRRVTINGLALTGNWNEGNPINPMNPPTLDPDESLTLFTGQITQGPNTALQGVNFDDFITRVLNENLDSNDNNNRDFLSIAIKASTSVNRPDLRLFPVESIVSKEGDPNLAPRLELQFDVGIEGHKTTDGPNFTFFSRAGKPGRTDWQFSLGTKSENGDAFVDQSDQIGEPQRDPDRYWTWDNGNPVPFELTCNEVTNLVTLKINNDPSRTTSFTANNCQDVDGLKIFAVAREQPNTSMRIIVNEAQEIGGTVQSVSGFSALSRANLTDPNTGTQRVENSLFFTDSVDNGGLGFTNGINLVRGFLRMDWPGGSQGPQNDNAGSRLQTQLIPLINIEPPQSLMVDSSPLPNEPNLEACSVLVTDEVWSDITADVDESICPENSSDTQTVPEPNSILSFMLLGTTGIGVRLLKKIA